MPTLVSLADFLTSNRQGVDQSRDRRQIDHSMADHLKNETGILLTPGDQFRNGEIVRLQAKRSHLPRVLVLNPHQSIPPTDRQYGGIQPDTLGIVAECVVEWGSLSDRSVYQIRIPRIPEGEQIRFNGAKQLRGGIRPGTENRLTSYDNDFVGPRNRSGCADKVFKLVPLHRVSWLSIPPEG